MKVTDIKIENVAETPPSGDGQLSELRERVGVELPGEFVAFLKAAGGSRISGYGFKIDGYTGTFSCPVIYSLHDGFGDYNLIAQKRDAQEHNGIPPQVIPFACAINGPGDALLLLDLTKEGGGRVLGYFAGKPAWTGRNTEGAWLQVAGSFEGYLAALFEESDEEE